MYVYTMHIMLASSKFILRIYYCHEGKQASTRDYYIMFSVILTDTVSWGFPLPGLPNTCLPNSPLIVTLNNDRSPM